MKNESTNIRFTSPELPISQATVDIMVNRARDLPSEVLLIVLSERGGHPGALADAAMLCARKSADYNQGMGHLNMHTVDRSSYFPFGDVSYAQMLHTKVLRFMSLVQKQLGGGDPEFEGLRDTALDIINYAGFFIASQDKEN